MSKKRLRTPDPLVVSVIVTITLDPDRPNVALSTTTFDVNGPEGAVHVVERAYDLGALNTGINAFVEAVERALSAPIVTVRSASAGRA